MIFIQLNYYVALNDCTIPFILLLKVISNNNQDMNTKYDFTVYHHNNGCTTSKILILDLSSECTE